MSGSRGVGTLFAVKAVMLIRPSGLVMVGNNNSAMYLHRTVVEVHSSDQQNTTRFINNTGEYELGVEDGFAGQ